MLQHAATAPHVRQRGSETSPVVTFLVAPSRLDEPVPYEGPVRDADWRMANDVAAKQAAWEKAKLQAKVATAVETEAWLAPKVAEPDPKEAPAP